MQFRNMAGRVALAAVLTTTAIVGPHAADVALGQGVPQAICGGQSIDPPKGIGQPDANGWTSRDENLQAGDAVRRYRFSVKEKGTAYVYIGDQWYDLNLGLFSVNSGTDVGCWTVQTKATSDTNEMHRLGFVRPDERAVEVEPGDYVLSARVGENAMVDPSRNFTVRVAVGPRVCSLLPANIPDSDFPGMTNKPDNPDLFQVGISFQPDAVRARAVHADELQRVHVAAVQRPVRLHLGDRRAGHSRGERADGPEAVRGASEDPTRAAHGKADGEGCAGVPGPDRGQVQRAAVQRRLEDRHLPVQGTVVRDSPTYR